MSPGLFFTGTDTGVGKTFITAAVARLLRQQGRSPAVFKPTATGAEWIDGRWRCQDTSRLAEAAGFVGALELVTPWAFPDAVAPPIAARRQGQTLSLENMVAAAAACGPAGSPLLVEGVGGLLCPLTEQGTVADLVAALGLPLVVVGRRSLGTLNHTLLTLEVARHRGLFVAGLVVNETERPHTLAEETNVDELRRRLDVPLLAVVPHQEEPGPEVPPSLAVVDWWRLCHAQPLSA